MHTPTPTSNTGTYCSSPPTLTPVRCYNAATRIGTPSINYNGVPRGVIPRLPLYLTASVLKTKAVDGARVVSCIIISNYLCPSHMKIPFTKEELQQSQDQAKRDKGDKIFGPGSAKSSFSRTRPTPRPRSAQALKTSTLKKLNRSSQTQTFLKQRSILSTQESHHTQTRKTWENTQSSRARVNS